MELRLAAVERATTCRGERDHLLDRQEHFFAPLRDFAADGKLHREATVWNNLHFAATGTALLLPRQSDQRSGFVQEEPDRVRVELRIRDALASRAIEHDTEQL